MGEQGQELKKRSEPKVEIQERGKIFFFYPPKVDKEEAQSPDDVQRLYMVLWPESGERAIEEKQEYPHSAGSKKSWNQPDDDGSTGKEEYDTSTKVHRRNAPARALGEGIYRILKHENTGKKKKKMHTHLIYKLEFPPEDQKNEPQDSLHVEREGSFVIQIKNPDQHHSSSQFRGLASKRRAVFPAHLQAQFGKLRFCPADPPDFLNYEGCEFLLISASDDIEEELGLELKPDEGDDDDDDDDDDYSCSDLLKTFGETASTDALLKGTWV